MSIAGLKGGSVSVTAQITDIDHSKGIIYAFAEDSTLIPREDRIICSLHHFCGPLPHVSQIIFLTGVKWVKVGDWIAESARPTTANDQVIHNNLAI